MQNLSPEMLKQIQEKSVMLQQKVAELRIEGSAGSDDMLVKVTINGKHEAIAVDIAPALMTQPVEVLQELTASAITDAAHKLDTSLQNELLNTFKQ